eukprot:CAMPEP_0205829822 /NCGR_PEP_ID=MMETSP0206-20130828/39309_1 /ASSEMBLY_ACC=CAM_ASM_000279 /TAXON_ID=36767 /ORGANISM="Euplotes focardii, Strain TN1" /LENGTH=46 /DNA_ID= /DNA_START= /DNA_END= /DNA_ORIENTATION=
MASSGLYLYGSSSCMTGCMSSSRSSTSLGISGAPGNWDAWLCSGPA